MAGTRVSIKPETGGRHSIQQVNKGSFKMAGLRRCLWKEQLIPDDMSWSLCSVLNGALQAPSSIVDLPRVLPRPSPHRSQADTVRADFITINLQGGSQFRFFAPEPSRRDCCSGFESMYSHAQSSD